MRKLNYEWEKRLVLWGGGLNLVWEFLQSPFYADWGDGIRHLLWTRFHCTVGDVLILLVASEMASFFLGGRDWPRRRFWSGLLLFTALGLSYTLFSEWRNVEVLRSWAYAPSMPRVFGFGLMPLLQWTLLPPLIVFLGRRKV